MPCGEGEDFLSEGADDSDIHRGNGCTKTCISSMSLNGMRSNGAHSGGCSCIFLPLACQKAVRSPGVPHLTVQVKWRAQLGSAADALRCGLP